MSDIGKLELEFLTKPDYGFAKIKLAEGQTVTVEASAMASMDTNIVMNTRMKGGVLSSLGRMAAGESLVLNDFTAENGPGELCIAPGPPGDIERYSVKEGRGIYLQSSCYVCSAPQVEIDTQWGGFKGFFSGVGIFLIKIGGIGDVIFNSYGALLEIPVKDRYTVDTGYVVAFEDSLQYQVNFLGGLKTSLFGGEGLVCEFNGEGKVWVQTRKFVPFAHWLWPFRPKEKSNK